MKFKPNKFIESATIFLIGIPVVGLLLGGIYSLPAIHFTRGREPCLSLLLSTGLAITVFGIGYFSQAPLFLVAAVWVFSLILLFLARKFFGALDHNVERFGLVHAFTLVVIFWIFLINRHGTQGNA